MGEFSLQYYLTIYFDVLGQREGLRNIKRTPASDEKEEKSLALVRDSATKVSMLREAFSKVFREAESHVQKMAQIPPTFRVEFIESTKSSYCLHGLSDAFVISVPLIPVNENCIAIKGAYSALAATCGIGLLALYIGVPTRAGLVVGAAVQLEEREIYGPAVERAMELANQSADSRLLVGDELLSYLDWVGSRQYSTLFGETAEKISKLCREMVTRDIDGRFMLDFLGQSAKEVLEISIIDKDVVDGARKFVESQDRIESQYRKYTDKGEERLISGYSRLLRYFESRKGVW